MRSLRCHARNVTIVFIISSELLVDRRYFTGGCLKTIPRSEYYGGTKSGSCGVDHPARFWGYISARANVGLS